MSVSNAFFRRTVELYHRLLSIVINYITDYDLVWDIAWATSKNTTTVTTRKKDMEFVYQHRLFC